MEKFKILFDGRNKQNLASILNWAFIFIYLRFYHRMKKKYKSEF